MFRAEGVSYSEVVNVVSVVSNIPLLGKKEKVGF